MLINFGTNASNCNIIFDINGNYTINNANMQITSNKLWNGRVAFPNGIIKANVRGIALEPSYLSGFNSRVDFPNSVRDLEKCFANRGVFNKKVTIPNSVTTTAQMFENCQSFNQLVQIPDSVINTGWMFDSCRNFNQPVQIPNNATDVRAMFTNCSNFNQPVQIPNNATNLYYMFNSCSNLNQNIQIPESVKSTAYMFNGCNNLNQNIHIPDSVTNMANMFFRCSALNQNIQLPNTNYNAAFLFNGCSNLNQNIFIPTLNGYQRNFAFAFAYCNQLSNITIGANSQTAYSCIGMIRSNNTQAINIHTDTLTAMNLINDKIIKSRNTSISDSAQIKPDWETITNGYYNAMYNVYIYTNTVFS